MWLWSKGLGRLILPMDIGKAEVQAEGETLVVKGVIIAPKVYWDYALSLQKKDLLDCMALLTDRRVVAYLVRERGFGFLGVLLRVAFRFGTSYLWAELKRLVRRDRRDEVLV